MFPMPIDPHGVVRRVLFERDDDDSRIDNFLNTIQESINTTAQEQMKKWNFDFANDCPLEGTWTWFKPNENEPSEWVGVNTIRLTDKVNPTAKDGVKIVDDSEKPENLSGKEVEEITPKPVEKSLSTTIFMRKRKFIDHRLPLDLSIRSAVRRRLDF